MVGQPFHSSPEQAPALSTVLLISHRSKRNLLSPVSGDTAVPKCLWQSLCWKRSLRGSWWQGEVGQAGGHSLSCLYFSLLLLV